MGSKKPEKKNESPTERQRRLWDKMAPRYDRQLAFCERHCFADGRDWIGARSIGDVLEVAIGTGLSLPSYPKAVKITGLELSPAMLEIASRRVKKLGITAELIEGDAEHIPFDDNSFDTVSCALALCSIPNPSHAIAEMARVLKPGGKLLLLDHIGSNWPPIWAAQWLIERISIRLSGEHYTRRQLHRVKAAGLQVAERERSKAGTVERICAIRPS